MNQPYVGDSRSIERCEINAEFMQIRMGISADKFTANFVISGRLLFQQQHSAAMLRQPYGRCAAGQTGTYDYGFSYAFRHEIPYRKGKNHSISVLSTGMAASRSRSRHSDAVNARATDTGASCRIMRLENSARTAYLIKEYGSGWRCRSLMNQPRAA